MTGQAGYSGTALPRKLGLKDGQSAGFSGLPGDLGWLADVCRFSRRETVDHWRDLKGDDFDYLHLFADSATTLDVALPALRARLAQSGILWVSWPKKAARVPTDVTEDVIRARALADILVDVKVCAVDAVWSGLKLVIRQEARV